MVLIDDLAAQVDRRTRLALGSQVSYLTGQRLEALAAADTGRHAQALGGALIDRLRRRGFTVITPAADAERAGNVCFLAEDAAGLAAALAVPGVLVWGGEGRIRVSPHVHCDPADVEQFFDALDAVGAARSPQSVLS